MPKLKLGELLKSEGILKDDQIKAALLHQKRWGKKMGRCLLDLGFINEKRLYETLSKSLRVPIIDLSRLKANSITRRVLNTIPLDIAREQRIVPLSIQELKGKTRLIVASSDPLNYKVLNDLRFACSMPIFVMIAPDGDIDWFIHRYYSRDVESADYVSVVYIKRIGQESAQMDLVESVFEDSLFESNTKKLKTQKD